jgi:hypothetical protein
MSAEFWAKVERGTDDVCWPWIGYKKPSGHGLTIYKSMPMHASRKAWILTHGHIAEGLCVNHRCDNAAARLNLDAEIVRALCELGGSNYMHGALIGPNYYVLERGIERYEQRATAVSP